MQCTTITAAGSSFTSVLNKTSLYEVHKFMSLDPYDLGYFIDQVEGAARVIGLTAGEAAAIKQEMSSSLTFRCKPKVAITPGAPLGPQSICTNKDCPLDPNPDCSAYDLNNGTSPEPELVNGPAAPSSSSATVSPSASGIPSNTSTPIPASHSSSKIIPIAVGVAVPVGIILIAIIAFVVLRSRRKMKKLENRLTQMEAKKTEPSARVFSSSDKDSYFAPSEPARSTVGSPPPPVQQTSSMHDRRVSSYSQQYNTDSRHVSVDQALNSQRAAERQTSPAHFEYPGPQVAPFNNAPLPNPAAPRHEMG
jgi:hypothetical protein